MIIAVELLLLTALSLASVCAASTFLIAAASSKSETRTKSALQPHSSIRHQYHQQTTAHSMMMMPSNKNADEKDGEIGQMRGGLVFLKTTDRPGLVKFYQETIGMEVWLEQPNITILSFGNLLLGFHQLPPLSSSLSENNSGNAADVSGMYTFVYPTRTEVDAMYLKLNKETTTADGPPRVNERYRIYQFFAKDPEGRSLEFQAFLHPLTALSSAVPD